MQLSLALTLLSALLTSQAMAHGIVTDIKIGNRNWWGGSDPNNSRENNPKRIVWSFYGQTNGPVTDVTSKDIVCKGNAKAPPATAPVNAGETVDLFWSKWSQSHRGPTMTYLADCKGKCSEVSDPSALGWFKIDEDGYHANTHTWASDNLRANNFSHTVTIPSDIKPGNYMLRHELLALHNARKKNGAQFYPMCANLEISGNGDAEPETVKFPGAYKDTDPGVYINIYNPKPTDYKIPGPPVYKATDSKQKSAKGSKTHHSTSTLAPSKSNTDETANYITVIKTVTVSASST